MEIEWETLHEQPYSLDRAAATLDLWLSDAVLKTFISVFPALPWCSSNGLVLLSGTALERTSERSYAHDGSYQQLPDGQPEYRLYRWS